MPKLRYHECMSEPKYVTITVEIDENDWEQMQHWVKFDGQPSIVLTEDAWPHDAHVEAIIVDPA
jgi:hypothetical protein